MVDVSTDHARMRGELTPVGWWAEDGLSFEQWKEVGRALGRVELAAKFARGDWLAYGEHRWGSKYAQAIDETGLDYGTLADEAYVARQVEFSLRNENLGWHHHKAVAPLQPGEQERWLERAEAEHMPVAVLRAEINRATLRPAERHVSSGVTLPTPVAAEPGERERIAEKVREVVRRGREESRESLRALVRPEEAEAAKRITKVLDRRDELRGGISVERLAEILRTGGGHAPEVRWATYLILDLVAALTRQTDPEEIAEQVVRPEHAAERLQQAEEAEEWFAVVKEALGRRAT